MSRRDNTDDGGENGNLPARENPELIGHEAAEAQLLDAYASGRLAHAWLISGPWGVGKATLAYRFARFVLAAGGGGGAADAGADMFGPAPKTPAGGLYLAPDHPVFRRVAAGGHSDLFTVERTVNDKTGKLRSEIVIDDVRDLGRFFHLTAGEGGWRIAVVDAADEMNQHAANAVLKVLEEPPARSLLLLVSHNPGRLLPTIRSRCRKLKLHPLPEDRVAALLAAQAPELPADDAAALAHLADGSPGRALALAREGGLDLNREMVGILETLPSLDVPALHAFGGRLARAGGEDAFATTGALLQRWLGRMIVAAAGAGDGLRATPEEQALLGRLGRRGGLDRWLEVWEKISRLLDRTENVNLDRKQVILNMFLAIEAAARS
jgi:DNA polymerase-3 subunit delta'